MKLTLPREEAATLEQRVWDPSTFHAIAAGAEGAAQHFEHWTQRLDGALAGPSAELLSLDELALGDLRGALALDDVLREIDDPSAAAERSKVTAGPALRCRQTLARFERTLVEAAPDLLRSAAGLRAAYLRELARRAAHQPGREASEWALSAQSFGLERPLEVHGALVKKHLQAELRVRDRTETLTPSNVRALLSSSDRDLRRAAWQFRRSVAAEQLTVLEPIKRARADFRVAQARLLGYGDVLEATLDEWRLSREGYDAVGAHVARGRDFFDAFYRWKRSALGESTFEEADLAATALEARSEWLGLDRVFVALHAAPGLSGDFKGVLAELLENRVLLTDTRATLSPAWFTLPHYGGGLPLVHVPYHRTLDDFCAAAHELGHACHTTVVSRKLGALAASDESLCYSETFSLAFEIAALNQALVAASSDEERRFWRAAILEQAAHFLRTLPIRARFDELVYLHGRPYGEAWAEAHAALSPAWLPCPSADDCTWVLATSSEDLPFHGHAYALAYLSAYAAYLQPDSAAIASLLEGPWEPIDQTYERVLMLDLEDVHAFDGVWKHLTGVLSDD